MGTHRTRQFPGYGPMQPALSASLLLLTILGIKYVGEDHSQHMLAVLQEHHKLSIHWSSTKFIGLTLDWDYANRAVHLSMPRYFNHECPKCKQHSPHPHVVPMYGAKAQCAEAPVSSPTLTKEETKYVQAVTETLLYYGHVVDPVVLIALNMIAMQQASPRQAMMSKITQILDFMASQEEPVLINNTIQPKRMKSMAIQFEWLKYREAKKQFRFYWQASKTNLANFFTKHHPPAHYHNMRVEF